jgi:hypothetical protein
MPVTVAHTTPSDGSFSAAGAAAWDANHSVEGLGTLAEQNSNNVSITGGSITGVSGLGTVTSVGGTGTVNGITLTGTVTSSGNLTLGGTLSGVSLTTQVSGTLPVGNGGTGQTTYTDGQLLIGNTTGNTLAKATLTAGTNISITNGAGAITINATDQFVGTVTSVSGTGTVNGITLTGTVTSSGSLTLGGTLSGVDLATQTTGTLSVSRGGTGATTLTGVVKGNGTSAFTAGTVSLTSEVSGTLPVANGGTGVTTSTGTGSVVLSTSPSFTGTANFGSTITTGSGVSTGDATIEVGGNRSSNGNAFIDLHAVAGTDFESRVIRFAGANGVMEINNAGTGGMLLMNTGAAAIQFNTASTERMRIASAGNVGIGTSSPNSNALLDVSSTTAGFLPPRMTTVQQALILTPPNGLMLYNTTTNKLQVYAAGLWVDLH